MLQRILNTFHQNFFYKKTIIGSTATLLIGGAREPLYIPASAIFPIHRIFYVGTTASSALHEIAHWCIAGAQRRLKTDYGYWYSSEDRDQGEQIKFMELEVYPQALEAIFHEDLGLPFHVSLDSFHSDSWLWRDDFANRVRLRKNELRQHGLVGRAALFSQALREQ